MCQVAERLRHCVRDVIARLGGDELAIVLASTPGGTVPAISIATRLVDAINPVCEWGLHSVCAEATAWPDDVKVAVNLSPVQFRHKRLVPLIAGMLEATGPAAKRLGLEITQTAMLQGTEVVMTTLRDLHEVGIQISMDDFGTGCSSLSHLHCFPFDKIKIDRSFISDLQAAPDDVADSNTAPGPLSAAANSALVILRTVVGLGQHLGISTTAQDVETAGQLAQIREEAAPRFRDTSYQPATASRQGRGAGAAVEHDLAGRRRWARHLGSAGHEERGK